jgi:hypothetical protein
MMNERIKHIVDAVNIPHQVGDNCYMVSERELAKFAELIVRECMAQCADNGSSDEWDKGVRWAVAQVKEHFGVEE